MSAAVHALGVLSTAVHVLDPVERIPLVLLAGDEITDTAIAEQITNPRCWKGNQVPTPDRPPPTTPGTATPPRG